MTPSPASQPDRSPARRSPSPPHPGPRRLAVFVAVTIALVAFDLASKTWAFRTVADAPVVLPAPPGAAPVPAHEGILVIPRLLAFKLTVNHGAVFGLGQGGRWIFVVFSLVAGVVILTTFLRSDRRAWGLHVALAAVLAGALGNLYDRVRFGVVRDLLHLFPDVHLPFGWSWPGPGGSTELYPWIFNVADVCLVLGLLAILLIVYRHDRRAAREARMAEEAA